MDRLSRLLIILALLLLSSIVIAQPLPPPDAPRENRSIPANQQRYLPNTTYADSDADYNGDHFGGAIDTDGDWMAVGSPDDDNAGAAGARRGTVDLFKRDAGGAWVKTQTLAAGTNSMYFGFAVSIWNDASVGILAVASPGVTVAAQGAAGSVTMYRRDTGSDVWAFEATLEAPVPEENARFGEAVSLSLSKIVIGAGSDRFGGTDMGAAYIFRRVTSPSIAWQFEQKLTAPDGASGDLFGAAVAINSKFGNRVLIGAPGNDVGGVDSGAAYLYDFNGSTWVSDGPRIDTPFGAAGDKFGAAVALSHADFESAASFLLIGMPGHASSTGAAASYYRYYDDDAIPIPDVITPYDGQPGDFFGAAVDLTSYGFYLLIGAKQDTTGALTDTGSVYHYKLTGLGDGYAVQGKYIGSLAESSDQFGYRVVFDSEGGFLVGVPYDTNGLGSETGAFYQIRPAAIEGLDYAPQVQEGSLLDAFFTVQLTTRPTSTVEVALLPDSQCALHLFGDSPGIPGAPLILTYTTSTGTSTGWNTMRSVVLRAADDAVNEGTHLCSVWTSVTSADSAYGSLPPIEVQVTVLDNDAEEILTNTSFEPLPRAGSLAPWILTGKTGDKVKCGIAAYDGTCAFMFKGGAAENSRLTYKIASYPLTRQYGDTVALTMQIQTTSASAKIVAKVKVKYGYGTDASISQTIIPDNSTDYLWYSLPPVDLGDPFVDPAPVITVTISNRSTSGKLYLDGVSLKLVRAGVGPRSEAVPPPVLPEGFRR